MHEDYVSYEVAKLLKEKKFHWNCHVCYDPRGESKELLVQEGISNVCYSVVYAAPTLYMAQKWLRETYAIYIVVKPHYSEKYEIVEFEYEIYSYDGMVIDKSAPIKSEEYYEFFTECMDNAILEALKLI